MSTKNYQICSSLNYTVRLFQHLMFSTQHLNTKIISLMRRMDLYKLQFQKEQSGNYYPFGRLLGSKNLAALSKLCDFLTLKRLYLTQLYFTCSWIWNWNMFWETQPDNEFDNQCSDEQFHLKYDFIYFHQDEHSYINRQKKYLEY